MKELSSCYAVTIAELEDCSREDGANACASGPVCTTVNDKLETCSGKD